MAELAEKGRLGSAFFGKIVVASRSNVPKSSAIFRKVSLQGEGVLIYDTRKTYADPPIPFDEEPPHKPPRKVFSERRGSR